jgi:glycosyltransferase involved in cell wall biosynthesis
MESNPLVSVVTPFYNTEEFLAQCIESVVAQSYTHWEYILVDNYSTDGSSEIAKGYAEKYPGKIRLVHTDRFLSQVQNYNFALSLISPNSKYCKVVQADDWIFPECLQQMVKVAEEHPSVGIVSAYELEEDHASLNGLPYPSPEVSGRDICRLNLINNIPLFGTPTSILMRSDLVRSRSPFYDEHYAPFEDGHACFEALRTWNFGFVHQVLTYSRRSNESILARIRPFQMILFIRLAELVTHGPKYLSVGEYRACLKTAEKTYFYFLGLSALQGVYGGAEFWKFHRESLASINYRMSRTFMAKWILVVLFDYLGNPKRLCEYLWPRRHRIASAFLRIFKTLRTAFPKRAKKGRTEAVQVTEYAADSGRVLDR